MDLFVKFLSSDKSEDDFTSITLPAIPRIGEEIVLEYPANSRNDGPFYVYWTVKMVRYTKSSVILFVTPFK